MNYWLVKSEPASYSWEKFVKDGSTSWTGVRNFQARNNLRAMKKGDQVFFYHSVTGKQILGLAKVTKEAYPDPTSKEGDWCAVELAPLKALKNPIDLEKIKADALLSKMALVRNSRISVVPVTEAEQKRILEFAG